MWVGMLLFANTGMLLLSRRPAPRGGYHVPAMYTGGNLGMVLGMFAGGWLAAGLAANSVPLAVVASFTGMTAGMLVGMLLGTWLTERMVAAVRAVTVLPRWLRAAERLPVTNTGG
jgi:hypothetical protein